VLLHEARRLSTWLIFNVSQEKMRPTSALVFVNVLFFLTAAYFCVGGVTELRSLSNHHSPTSPARAVQAVEKDPKMALEVARMLLIESADRDSSEDAYKHDVATYGIVFSVLAAITYAVNISLTIKARREMLKTTMATRDIKNG